MSLSPPPHPSHFLSVYVHPPYHTHIRFQVGSIDHTGTHSLVKHVHIYYMLYYLFALETEALAGVKWWRPGWRECGMDEDGWMSVLYVMLYSVFAFLSFYLPFSIGSCLGCQSTYPRLSFLLDLYIHKYYNSQ
ncbi:hypothetical protein M413DRAFT_273301 [Hebeloma cylindrosporum]|uniref:Uncharacterized protein n=1 Tax=Hebeloma cylindrosporum TaxID=76867 RepID=A0A0C2YBX9_HEBCY|nr:hypothetical protein M413DRAFT_273301 [Hebeloma cylindrosporum h7]